MITLFTLWLLVLLTWIIVTSESWVKNIIKKWLSLVVIVVLIYSLTIHRTDVTTYWIWNNVLT